MLGKIVIPKIVKSGLQVLRGEGLASLMKKSSQYIFSNLFRYVTELTLIGNLIIPFVTQKFIIKTKNIKTIEQYVDLSFSFKHLGVSIRPLQIREEITDLLKLLKKLRPKMIVEIGTDKGGTLFLFSRVSNTTEMIISIDLCKGRHGYPAWKIPFYKSFGVNSTIHLIRADSHSHKTLKQVKSLLGVKKVDFLFIDGDHSYEGVAKDFELFSPLVRKGGIVAFHDICESSRVLCGVSQFWRELKERDYNFTEIIKDPKQELNGIGIIHMK